MPRNRVFAKILVTARKNRKKPGLFDFDAVFIELLSARELLLLSLVASQRLRQTLLEALVDADTANGRQHPIASEIAPQSRAAYLA